MLFHISQAFLVLRAILAEHFCALGNGIDRGSTGNCTYIIGSAAIFLLRNLNFVDFGHDLRQLGNGIGHAKALEGMAALGLHFYFIPVRTNASVVDKIQIAVKGNKPGNSAFIIPEQLAGTFQIAQAFFAGVADKQIAAFRPQVIFHTVFCHTQHHHKAGSIIAHTGTMDLFTVIHIRHRFQIRKYRVRMCYKYRNISASLTV